MKKNRMTLLALLLMLVLLLAACGGGAPAATPAPATPTPDAGTQEEANGEEEEEEPTIEFPTRNITIYNPSVAGAPADIMARELGRAIEDLTGVSVQVVNATGGAGGVMMASVFSQPTDGYTWGSITAGHITSLQGGLDQDFPFENFIWTARTQNEEWALVVLEDAPWETLEDMAEYARDNPFVMGGSGVASSGHLISLTVADQMDFDMSWVPFDGGPETIAGLLGAHVDAVIITASVWGPHYEAGSVRILGMGGDTRTFDEIPTFAEYGLFVPFSQYRGIFLAAGTPPELVQAVSDLIYQAVQQESWLAYMDSLELGWSFQDHVEFSEFVTIDYRSIEEIIRELLDM